MFCVMLVNWYRFNVLHQNNKETTSFFRKNSLSKVNTWKNVYQHVEQQTLDKHNFMTYSKEQLTLVENNIHRYGMSVVNICDVHVENVWIFCHLSKQQHTEYFGSFEYFPLFSPDIWIVFSSANAKAINCIRMCFKCSI